MIHAPNSKQSVMACTTDTWQAQRNRNGSGWACIALPVTLALALGLMATLVWMVRVPNSRGVQAMPGDRSPLEQREIDADVIRVATTGVDTPDCGTVNVPCRTVQYAVDKAQAGGEIRVAAGTYNDIHDREGLTQTVYLTKSLTIKGGYTTSNWTAPDPKANPTILDAEGAGRVLVISPTITVHLEGLRFQDGDATGLGGGTDGRDAGGGLYILTSTVTISNCSIFGNTGSITGTVPGSDIGGGLGGGIYARAGSVELTHNEIVSNTAGVNVISFGGGIYLDHGSAMLLQNTVMSNTASYWDVGQGGGLYLDGSFTDTLHSAILLENILQGNYASRTSDGQGGGMYANHYDLELLDNLVQHNTGGTALEGKGGGLYIFLSRARLERNLIQYNVASRGDEGTSGGLHFCTSDDVNLQDNTIFSNTASTKGNGYGGGVSFCKTMANLDSNTIISNTATFSTALDVRGWGGGVWTGDNASVSFNNDLIAGNHAKTQGGGLWFGVELDEYNPWGHRLEHVTIADNSGDYNYAHGVYVINTAAFLTNTIIAGHADFGIFVATGGEATLEATLWYDNRIDHTYGSSIEIGDLNFHGDPSFVDPVEWDYHIGEGSAAMDQGVVTEVRDDMDGERRPWLAPDLGADEYWPPGAAVRAYLPLILRQSSQE